MAMPEKTEDSSVGAGCRSKKGEHKKVFEKISKTAMRARGWRCMKLLKNSILRRIRNINIESLGPYRVVSDKSRSRPFDSIEAAFIYRLPCDCRCDWWEEHLFSNTIPRPRACGFTVGELYLVSFSFNAPLGACPECIWFRSKLEVDLDLISSG